MLTSMRVDPDLGDLEPSPELCAITARWFESIHRHDVESVLARFSTMTGIAVWGTDFGEYIDDPELLRRYVRLDYAEGGYDEFDLGKLRIEAWVEGPVGWSLTDATMSTASGGQEFRSTLVFHLEQDEWKIIHEHWSFAAPEHVHGRPFGRTLDLLSQAASEDRPDLTAWTSGEGTTTLVFTDIENSTGLNASYGDTAWLQVLGAHNEIIERATTDLAGTVVKSQGDGFMLAFPSASKGLNCAHVIRRRIEDRFNDPGSPIRVRIGVHTGEVVSDADDFFGHAVNYAARVAGAASGGEILASALVHDLVERTGSFVFEPPREVELKGIGGRLQVYPLADAATNP